MHHCHRCVLHFCQRRREIYVEIYIYIEREPGRLTKCPNDGVLLVTVSIMKFLMIHFMSCRGIVPGC